MALVIQVNAVPMALAHFPAWRKLVLRLGSASRPPISPSSAAFIWENDDIVEPILPVKLSNYIIVGVYPV